MTLLIKNAQLVGDETLPEHADVFVQGNRIAAIGRFQNKKADLTIDGQGKFLSPGLIDIDTLSDVTFSLLRFPAQEHFLRQGVTSIVGGMQGFSLAPFLSGSEYPLADMRGMNADWTSLRDFYAMLKEKKLGVHFGTSIGYTTIRDGLFPHRKALKKEERARVLAVLRQALEEGALGVSVDRTYGSGAFLPYAEVREVAVLVAAYGACYATPLSHGPEETIAEIAKVAQETGVRMLLTNFSALPKEEQKKVVQEVSDIPTRSPIFLALSPLGAVPQTLHSLLPRWLASEPSTAVVQKIRDDWFKKRIYQDMPKVDPAHTYILHAPTHPVLVGQSLSDFGASYEIATNHDLGIKEALVKLMEVTALRGLIFHEPVMADFLSTLPSYPHLVFASSAADLAPSYVSPTSRTIASLLAYAEAAEPSVRHALLQKATSHPAQLLGLSDRGVLREGAYADLILWKDGVVSHVLLDGALVLEDGVGKESGFGIPLRRG